MTTASIFDPLPQTREERRAEMIRIVQGNVDAREEAKAARTRDCAALNATIEEVNTAWKNYEAWRVKRHRSIEDHAASETAKVRAFLATTAAHRAELGAALARRDRGVGVGRSRADIALAIAAADEGTALGERQLADIARRRQREIDDDHAEYMTMSAENIRANSAIVRWCESL